MIGKIGTMAVAVLLGAGALHAQTEEALEQARAERDQDRAERAQARAERDQDRAERAADRYERAMDLVDDSQWKAAIDAFQSVVKENDGRADAALYWQSYAWQKLGRAQEALATLGALRNAHPKSRWLKEADALELEIKGRAGQPPQPENVENEELKLIAIQNLMHMESGAGAAAPAEDPGQPEELAEAEGPCALRPEPERHAAGTRLPDAHGQGRRPPRAAAQGDPVPGHHGR